MENIFQLTRKASYDLQKINNKSKLCLNDVVLIQEENRPKVKRNKVNISKSINGKDGLVRRVELVVDKEMSDNNVNNYQKASATFDSTGNE